MNRDGCNLFPAAGTVADTGDQSGPSTSGDSASYGSGILAPQAEPLDLVSHEGTLSDRLLQEKDAVITRREEATANLLAGFRDCSNLHPPVDVNLRDPTPFACSAGC